MTAFKVGDRVRYNCRGSSYHGAVGTVDERLIGWRSLFIPVTWDPFKTWNSWRSAEPAAFLELVEPEPVLSCISPSKNASDAEERLRLAEIGLEIYQQSIDFHKKEIAEFEKGRYTNWAERSTRDYNVSELKALIEVATRKLGAK